MEVPRYLGKGSFLNKALNIPIQGLGAELMALALTKAEKALHNNSGRLINVIHDELVVECDKKDSSTIQHIVETAMCTAFAEIFPEHTYMLQGLVEAKSGKNWAEAK